MKKHVIYVLMLTLLLAGCAAPPPVEEPVPLQEAPSVTQQREPAVQPQSAPGPQIESAPKTSAQPEQQTLEFRVEGMEETVPVTVYQGRGYTVSIPVEGWRLEQDADDGAYEETWESTVNDDVELQVSRYEGRSAAEARTAFIRDHDDYRFDDPAGSLVTGQERDGDVLAFFSREQDGVAYIVSWQYPAYAAEGFGARLRQMAETFQLTN
jgi:hypothetical protein